MRVHQEIQPMALQPLPNLFKVLVIQRITRGIGGRCGKFIDMFGILFSSSQLGRLVGSPPWSYFHGP